MSIRSYILRLLLMSSIVLVVKAARAQDSARHNHLSHNAERKEEFTDTNEVGHHVFSLYNHMDAGDESDVTEPERKIVRFNEYQEKYISLKIGGGYLEDFATFSQNSNGIEQVKNIGPNTKLRDWRFTFKGRVGPAKMKHEVTYTLATMFDYPTKKWLFRETGIMVVIPEIWGQIFVGRTKEGFSMNKVMVGYAGWTQERSAMSDATVPILGDGIKYIGYTPNRHFLWNIGVFTDELNQNQSFSTYDHQGVARLMWLPIISEADKTVFHIGLNLRQGKVDGDTLQLRSRPEAWTAPYFVDTKKFYAQSTFMYGEEIYYRKGPWLFGSEYWFESVNSQPAGNPTFHGGEVVATWLITGDTREYNTVGGFFRGISPDKSLFEGGPGAVEAVLRLSYIDLDGGTIHGGQFWRITPMVNWHVSDNLRLEFTYGYGQLYRFDIVGGTQFFQARVQLQL